MTRLTLVVGLCALAITSSSAGAPGAAGQGRPLLAVADTSPFEIRGAGFGPGERVQILLAVNGSQFVRSTVATAEGRFRASFRVTLGPCGRFTLRAFGSKGSRARVLPKRLLPDCVSPTAAGSHT
jgi:hypothetical protein